MNNKLGCFLNCLTIFMGGLITWIILIFYPDNQSSFWLITLSIWGLTLFYVVWIIIEIIDSRGDK